jgi:RimJ/RimL family protein N-acetyltransferase
LRDLILQPAQEWARPSMDRPGYGDDLARLDSYAGIIDGRVVLCAGLGRLWEGRAEAWALIARDIGPKGMHEAHYAVRRHLESSTLRRIEAACDAAFLQAHRWLYLLGFKYEGPLKSYTPDGRDCIRFARVR